LNAIAEGCDILGRAWNCCKRHKFLWVLGFVAAVWSDLLSHDRIGQELNFGGEGALLRANVFDLTGWARGLRLLGGSLVAAALLTLAAGIVLLVAVLLARGSLIAAAADLDRGQPSDVPLAVDRARPVLGRLVLLTAALYGPYLVASQLAGEALKMSLGLLKPAVCLLLLALLVLAAGLALLHPLAVCAAILDGLRVRASIERAWRLARENSREALMIGGALLGAWVLLDAVRRLLLSPLADVSLLALLLGGLRSGWLSFGGTLGFLILGCIATAVMTPVYAVGLVALSLAYEKWRTPS